MQAITHKKRIQSLYTYKGRPTIMIGIISYVDINSIPEGQSVEDFIKSNFPETEKVIIENYGKSKAPENNPEAPDPIN